MNEHEKINSHTAAPQAETDQPGTFFGMKIIFNKPVGLYPVKVERQTRRTPKSRGNQNGSY